MPHQSDPSFLVLHGLRLKGFAAAEAVAATSGVSTGEVERHLEGLGADGLAVHREGRITGWALTPAGRTRHQDLVAAELIAARCRPAVDIAYRAFLEINQDLLTVCTDWQVKSTGGVQTPNAHDDAAYDGAVVDRLIKIDDAVQPICGDLGDAMERFARYAERLGTALAKVRAGEIDWFTKPMIDSYHTVWFELHEDLLVTLGIERHREGGS